MLVRAVCRQCLEQLSLLLRHRSRLDPLPLVPTPIIQPSMLVEDFSHCITVSWPSSNTTTRLEEQRSISSEQLNDKTLIKNLFKGSDDKTVQVQFEFKF